MNMLPESYQQPYPQQAGQPTHGWPTTPIEGHVELYGERPAIVYVPDAYGQMVPMLKHQAPALPERTPQRDLTPQPLIDPRAQILAAGGLCAAGTGYGIGQALSAVAGLGTGTLVAVAALVVAARIAPAAVAGRSKTVINHTTNVTNHNRWWGKSKSTANH